MTRSARATDVAELMEAPDADPKRVRRTLRRFDAVNRAVAAWRQVYRSRLRPVIAGLDRPARIIDIGSGGGDVLRRLVARARRDGFDAVLLERRADPRPGTRVIGLHPPTLAALEPSGAADRILADAVRILRGIAMCGGRVLGEVRFDRLAGRRAQGVRRARQNGGRTPPERRRAAPRAARRCLSGRSRRTGGRSRRATRPWRSRSSRSAP